MNKIIILSLLLSFPIFSQDIEPVPADAPMTEENIEALTTPVPDSVVSEEAVPAETPDPEVTETPAPVTTEEKLPETEPIALDASETPVITTEPDLEDRNFNPYKSHWLVSFGFEGLKYEVPFEFDGKRKNIEPRDQELYGGRIGFGGEMYLGAGLMTTTKVEGYYVGTLFARRLNAGPDDEDEEFAFTKTIGQVWGFDVSQSLSYLFDMKTKNPIMDEWTYLTVEPFIEAGVGVGWAFNRITYEYDLAGSCAECADEAYKQVVEDSLINARIGAGFNLISSGGYFFYMKAHVNTFDIKERKIETFTKPDGQAGDDNSEKLKDVNIDPVITYAIGGGYKF